MPKKTIKVAFIINNLGMGGAENMLIEQLKCLDRNSFEPYLITLLPNPDAGLVSRVPEDVKFIKFNFSSIFDLRSFYGLWSCLRKEKFKAVVASLFNANLLARMAAILARVPVILSSELNVLEDKRTWQIVADNILARFTKKILVSSNEVLKFTSEQEKLPESKFQLNFNAVPLKLTQIKKSRDDILSKLGFPTGLTYIVTAGSLTPQKGQKYLVEAVAQLKERGVRNFKVLIFGRGTLRNELLKQISSLNLAEDIKLMGLSTMEEILAISDVFTLPSLWEGLSIALLNAMDAGCPIVATKISGTNEVLKDDVNGLLVEPGKSDGLSQALECLLQDEALRKRLAKGAQERVKKFSIEKNVKVIESLIFSS